MPAHTRKALKAPSPKKRHRWCEAENTNNMCCTEVTYKTFISFRHSQGHSSACPVRRCERDSEAKRELGLFTVASGGAAGIRDSLNINF